MVISDEIKFPRVLPVDPYRADRKVEAVDGTPPIARIGAFKREWNRRRGSGTPRENLVSALSPDEAAAIRLLVERVNASFNDHRIMLHLVLVQTDEGYAVDIYDCTGQQACTVVRDFEIALSDLPLLLRNLEEEAGLLIDTVS